MVKDLLVSLKNEGTTIFFNTHILADVESICDRISIIHN
jgi:ABC-2 type transport system ATP-binding protein